MDKVAPLQASTPPQRIEPNKVALVFGSSFMLLAIGGGAPGLFSLELSLIAGGLSLPFFGLALSQCKKTEAQPASPPPFTYERFQAAFTGKKSYILRPFNGWYFDIPLDPQLLGGAHSFEEYLEKLHFSLKVLYKKLSRHSGRKFEPICYIGPHQRFLTLPPSSGVASDVDYPELPSNPFTVETLQQLYEVAKRDQGAPYKMPSPTDQRLLEFAQTGSPRVLEFSSNNTLYTLQISKEQAGMGLEAYKEFIVSKLEDALKDRVRNKKQGWTPYDLWIAATSIQLRHLDLPAPSSLNLTREDFFATQLDQKGCEAYIKLYAKVLAPALLDALRTTLSQLEYDRLFYFHACGFPSIRVAFQQGGAPFNPRTDVQTTRDAFMQYIHGILRGENLETMAQAHAMLSTFSIMTSVSTKVSLSAEAFPCPDYTHYYEFIIRDWLPHFEAALLSIKPSEAHGTNP